ncbi:NAD(P)H-dependent oxidoreductase subunit E [candidate division KSB1 bacterium 4572_119]|nr:MAG: NAD(P)H-dependent oxidoreductase subunit E [candidate division KSB1 bacterium 4572_119]
MEQTKLDEIISANGNNRKSIIPVLQEIQATYNYLPKEELQYISEKMDIPLIELFSIASFYSSFSLTPRGKHLVQVCLGTACHVRGAHRVLDESKKRLQIEPDETTDDQQFTLKTVNCLGACALGPIVVIDNDYHGNTRAQKVNAILAQYKSVNNNGNDTTE